LHLELLIPDLIAPDAGAAAGLSLPALERLLGRAVKTIEPPMRVDTWLCEAGGLDAELQAAPPSAALSLLGEGGEPGTSAWLRADPVHMRVDRKQLLIDVQSAASLNVDDAAALLATLNAHFAQDGMNFRATVPQHWYFQVGQSPAAIFAPLDEAEGRNADALRPTGADALAWQRIANEAQMLLHEHPVNIAREARGENEINSVWFWGPGALPQPPQLRFRQIWSDDPVARGLGLLASTPVAAPPLSAAHWLEHERARGDEGRYLIVLDALRKTARERGIEAWRSTLADFERLWFQPLLDALRGDRIGMLTLHALAPHCALTAEAIRGDLLKFWRRTKPLAAYAGLHP
jgi:hypothetical protein